MTQWKTISSLEQGGFGMVSIVEHPVNKKKFAMKKLRRSNNLLTTARRQKHFVNEIEILNQLDHPHIITIVESQTNLQDWFILFDLALPGDLLKYLINLSQCVHENNLDSHCLIDHTQKTRQWAASLISAIDYLHQRNIFHRDIKLENCLLQGNHLLLADFGFATKVTRSHEYIGSPPYIAPEQRQRLTAPYYTDKADLYSLGVLLSLLLVDISIIDSMFSFFDKLYFEFEPKYAVIIRSKISRYIDSQFSNTTDPWKNALKQLCDPSPKQRQLAPLLSFFQTNPQNKPNNESKTDVYTEIEVQLPNQSTRNSLSRSQDCCILM